MKNHFISSLILSFALATGFEAAAATPEPGTKMPDGTIYAGLSEHREKLYTTPADAPGKYNAKQAAAYCKKLTAYGHDDWRLPVFFYEMYTLVENQNKGALKGTFSRSSAPTALADYYRTAASDRKGELIYQGQEFHGRLGQNLGSDTLANVRCVRGRH